MPRNGSGTYTLPSGNPVVSGTLIEANWANTTLSDIGNELTDSLSRSGEGGMTAALRVVDGTSSLPGLAFGTEPATGLYRAGTSEAWFVVSGTSVQQYTATGTTARFAAGAVGTPSVTVHSDTNTGFFFPAADTIAATVGGAEVLRLTAANMQLSGVTPFISLVNGASTDPPGGIKWVDTGATRGQITHEGDTGEMRFTSGYATYGGFQTWYTDGSERVRLDSSGNLGVGTTSPGSFDGSADNLVVGTTSGNNGITIAAGTTGASTINFADGTAGGAQYTGYIDYVHNGDYMRFGTNGGNERFRLTSGGDLLVGTTSAGAGVGYDTRLAVDGGAAEAGIFKTSGGANAYSSVLWNTATTGNNLFALFGTEGTITTRGSITYNRGAGQVAYNITSDVRLKNNIANAADSGDKVDAIKVRQFDWKETGNHVDYGFVAQELHEVAPHAVTKPEDDENMWSVDYSKLVPMLVKEIQSLRARVAALEGA